MAVPVGNLLRKLKECISHESNLLIAVHLEQIKKVFERVKPYLRDAEWKRDLHDTEWRRNVNNQEELKIKKYEKISRWVSQIAALAVEVEEIIVTYDLYLFDKNTSGSLFSKFLSSRFLIVGKDTLSTKIQQFLSRSHQQTNSIINGNGFHSSHQMRSHRHISSENNVSVVRNLTLPSNRACPTDSTTSWHKHLFGMDSLELLGQFSEKATKEMQRLIWEALNMNLVRITHVQAAATTVPAHDSRRATQMILETSILGRQEEVSKLESWLMVEEEQSDPVIISVTGVGGIGKTTIAAAVYESMRHHFNCHAWASVFQSPTTSLLQDVLRGILKSMSMMAPRNIDAMNDASLREMIRSRLVGKKFLLVLDDVMKKDEWEYVKSALPQDCQAKILLTSGTNLQYLPDCKYAIHIPRLTPQNAFNLLQKRVCLQQTTFWPSVVKSEAEEILGICKGIPLAIATIGGLLSTKQMETKEWTIVRHMLSQAHFTPLCYSDLHAVLKSCFLYAALFPLNSEIPCKRLQQLWIAEGFVQARATMTAEEAARLQMEELIWRNMIQMAQVGLDGEVETCRVLRPMREFALKRSEQDKFSSSLLDRSGNALQPERPHHLSLSAESSSIPITEVDKLNLSGMYSLLLFKGYKHQPLFITSVSSFRLLSVLEIQHLTRDDLPDSVGDLGLLRYLGLRGTKLKKLPTSLKKLQRLQTLDIRDTFIRDLPDGLEGMKMLRHLLLAGSFGDKVVNLVVAIEVFKDLQTLAGVGVTEGITKGLHHLPQLQKLSVGEVKSCHSVTLFESIDHMKFLRSLTIKCAPEEHIDMISCNPLENLEKLRIGGPIDNLLAWIEKLHSLKYLYLWDCLLMKDPLSALQHLPSLVLLSLCNAYNGKEIQFGTRAFLKLKKLSILRCKKLERWTAMKDGAMGKLQTLTIAYCPNFTRLPRGLGELTSLQALQVADMPAHFIKEARDIQSTSTSKFSLLVRETTQLSAYTDAKPGHKMLPISMFAHLMRNIEETDKHLPRQPKLKDKKEA
ncbi:disease resistance protein RPM1-like [Cornus florida]|uniref:disease resistance protein RPM1-like n=1 Tax=Cornus florida TaxID=4283 RepID=UPI00289A5D80|nr:disease resistance protein RPM1-like [Cornus florida]